LERGGRLFPALSLMGICIALIPLEAGVGPIILASTTGLGLSTVYLFSTIRNLDHQRRLVVRSAEKIASRLREFAAGDWTLSADYFQARLEQEIGRAKRYDMPLSVMFMQVSLAGLSEGPAVVAAGSALLRNEDIFAPMGRGEYAFFLPQTEEAGAQVVMTRLTDALEDYLSIFGIACLSPERMNAKLLLDAARANARRRLVASTWNEGRAVS
jgi:hypothetical protein